MLRVGCSTFQSEVLLRIDDKHVVEFLPAGMGIQVSLHALHTLLGLIV